MTKQKLLFPIRNSYRRIQKRLEVPGNLTIFENILYYFKNKTCSRYDRKQQKDTAVINSNASGSSEKEIQSTYMEISPWCGCGAASCENCPRISGMEMGIGSDKNYRNVFSYLRVVAVILAATWIIKEALTMF